MTPPPPALVVPRRSAMGALQLAIDDALAANADAAALFGDRVYSLGTVPKEPVAPYVELGDSAERSAGVFMQGGNASDETLTAVTPRALGKPGAGRALAALVDALEGRKLAIDGHTLLVARLELLAVVVDPDVAHLRAVCRLSVSTLTDRLSP